MRFAPSDRAFFSMTALSMLRFRTAALIAVTVLTAGGVGAQPKTIVPDLTGAPGEHGWKLINRAAALIDKDGEKAIRLEGKNGTGFVRLENVTFADGVIEFDARGKNAVQQSFLGVAFHGADVKTYDAVYFRPFNFRSDDPARRAHAVQYISAPTHPWQKLREQFPGKYENAVAPAPDPDGWFHARVVVAWPKVSVFVNDAKEPSLVVNQLNDRKRGWLALWVDVSGGDFANLRVTPAPETK
jgi:hypothetical protein